MDSLMGSVSSSYVSLIVPVIPVILTPKPSRTNIIKEGLFRQVLASLLALSFNVVLGIALAYSAILNPELAEDNSEIQTTENQRAWVASVLTLSMLVGAPVGAILMDTLGRLNTMKIACGPNVIGWTLIAVSTSFPTLMVGRILIGIASILGTAPAMVYITEIARTDMRGSLISFGPGLCSVGIVMAYVEGWILSWRLTAWLCVFYSVVVLMLPMFIPDSPVFLIAKGRREKALKSLKWFMKSRYDSTEEGGQTLAQIQFAILERENEEKKASGHRRRGVIGVLSAFSKPTGYKPFLILFGLFVIQQFSGIYITLFYTVEFFDEMETNINPYLSSILIGLVRAIMSLVISFMLKRYHRRPLLIWSCLGMALTMFVSGLFTIWIKNGTTTLKWVPVLALMLYVVISMIGLLSIPWIITAELFPIEIRAIAHSALYAIAYLLMFVSVQYYHPLKRLCGGIAGVQWFFAVVSFVGMIYTILLLPETYDCELNEIGEYFQENTFYLWRKKKSIESM